MFRRRVAILFVSVILMAFLAYQFWPAGQIAPLPTEPEIAVWMGVTWSMDAHTDEEITALAEDLKAHSVDYAYVYVSYLRAGDTFNPTYDHAAEFTRRLKTAAPDIKLLAWVGVPVDIEQPDGTYELNRLLREDIRDQIAEFAVMTVTELGFDGFHLNAELIRNNDTGLVNTLDAIRAALPEDTLLSTTAHALRLTQRETSTVYPNIAYHWSADYLRTVADHADQIAVMAYDSFLAFPRDYRSWIEYQTEASAAALVESDVELIIGLPVSEEWTFGHQTQAETLRNALFGLSAGYNEGIAGIALYAYWEASASEWAQLEALMP